MAWTNIYDTNTPLGTETPTLGDNKIRGLKAAIQERMVVDHDWDLTGTEVGDLEDCDHKKVTFNVAIATPTPAATKAILYTKTDVDPQLHFIPDGGCEVALTTDSSGVTVLNVTAAAIAKANTNIVDNDTITHTAGVLALKEDTHATKGIRKGHLSTDAKSFADGATIEIDGTNGLQAKVPAQGAGADASFLSVGAYGSYTGNDGANTITVFNDAAQKIRHLIIRNSGNNAATGGVEALLVNAGQRVWEQRTDDLITSGLTLTDNTFVLSDNNQELNNSSKTYYYIAYGEWAT